MPNKYTYKKSGGEDIWTVGHDGNGKWIPESDWSGDERHGGEWYASVRAAFLNSDEVFTAEPMLLMLRKRIEEMMEDYRRERAIAAFQLTQEYHRGAADACGLILDLPELRLFLPAKGEQDAID